MELQGVEVKKVLWTAKKVDDEGEEKAPPKVTLTLEISSPNSEQVKDLIDFAKDGACVWTVGDVQRQMKG